MTSSVTAAPSNRRRALVVDDSQIAQHVLARLLQRTGLEVEVEDSAEAALERLNGDLPDVIFMDQILPGMDGLDAVRSVRARSDTRDLPVVMYTAQTGSDFAARAMLAGANDVFIKTGPTKCLDSILAKLGLTPSTNTRTADGRGNVVAARLTPAAAVADAIRPLIRAEQEKLRQELLAEFAILERYEERVRQDLFARVGTLMHASSDRIDRLFKQHTRESRHARPRGGGVLTPILAAAALIASVGAISLLWDIERTNQRTIEQLQAAFAAVSAQAGALAEVESSLAALEAGRATPVSSGREVAVPEPPAMARTAGVPNAAVALIDEIQSMGILGPIRIETNAGAFCVSSRFGRSELEAGSLSLDQCESVPALLAVASR